MHAITGIFGSKNYFSLVMAVYFITAVSVALDRTQPWRFRWLGIFGSLVGPPLLVLGQSTGALLVSAVAVLITVALHMSIRLQPLVRVALAVLMVLLITFFIVLATFYFQEFSEVLEIFGKDLTLTGRIFLWEHAQSSISDNPILGVGYQAYWQQGNPGAEECWAYAGLTGKFGYHFHNTFLEVAVELGFVGLGILLVTFFCLAVDIFRIILTHNPRREVFFATAAFILVVLRTPLEVDLFYPFQIATILLCLSWVYLRQPISANRLFENALKPRLGLRR
jgi:exopolysaccharide production protein ExoQ